MSRLVLAYALHVVGAVLIFVAAVASVRGIRTCIRTYYSPLERLRREIRSSTDAQLRLGTRHDTLLAIRGRMCRYHPDNDGRGRQPGDPRHFQDYVEHVLGPAWGNDEAAAAFVAQRDATAIPVVLPYESLLVAGWTTIWRGRNVAVPPARHWRR